MSYAPNPYPVPTPPTFLLVTAARTYVVIDLVTLLPSTTTDIASATMWRHVSEAGAYLVANPSLGACEIRPTYRLPGFYSTVYPLIAP